jgi:hypothetical protein
VVQRRLPQAALRCPQWGAPLIRTGLVLISVALAVRLLLQQYQFAVHLSK